MTFEPIIISDVDSYYLIKIYVPEIAWKFVTVMYCINFSQEWCIVFSLFLRGALKLHVVLHLFILGGAITTHTHMHLSLSNSKGVNSNIQTVDIEGKKIELQIRLVLFVLYSNTIIIVNSDISSIQYRIYDITGDEYRDAMVIYGVQ